MKDNWYSLLHSYQYLPINSKLSLGRNNTEIIDSKGNFIVGLKNIPTNNNLYKVELNNILPKKRSLKHHIQSKIDNIGNEINYKVLIKINISCLFEMISNGDSIPFRVELFKLFRRNKTLKKDNPYNKILIKKIFQLSRKPNIIDINLMSYHLETIMWISERERCLYKQVIHKDIVKLDNIFLDVNKEKFYFNRCNQVESKINIKGGILMESDVTLPRLSLIYNLIMDNNKLNLDPNIISNKLISQNTLIISSHSNIDNWKKLIDKSNIDVLIIQNKVQLTKLTYRNIINKKIVILSINCLNHATYLNFWDEYMSNNQTYKDALDTISEERSKNRSLINSNKVIFQLIYWNRIIFDNVLNIIYNKNNVLKSMVYLFECNKRWILDNNYDDFDTIYDFFIRNKNKLNKLNLSDLKFLTRNMNISEGIKSFYKKKVINLSYSEIEYNYYKTLKTTNDKIFFNSMSSNFIKLNYIKYGCVKKKIKNFSSLINDKCSICLEKLEKESLGVTSCNHLFCYKCILSCSQQDDKCPKCRSCMTKNNIYKVVDDDYIENFSYNTKLTFLIKYLENKNNVLILSLFSSTLDTIKDHLPMSYLKRIDLLNYNSLKTLSVMKKYDEIIYLEPIDSINNNFIDILSTKLFTENNFYNIDLTEISFNTLSSV